jgi:flagellar hook-length control protein FliK
MSETAQLLNLLTGLMAGASASGSAPRHAPGAEAKPGADAPDGFLALLALASANTELGAPPLTGLSLANAQAAGAAADGLETAADAQSKEGPESPTQPAAPVKPDNAAVQLLVLLSPSDASTAQDDAAAPSALQDAQSKGADIRGAGAPAMSVTSAALDVASTVSSETSAASLPGAASPPASDVTPESLAPQSAQAHEAKPAAAQSAETSATAPAQEKADALAAATEKASPPPTRQAILNASLTSVAATLLSEKPAPTDASKAAQPDKPAAKPAEAVHAAAAQAKDAAPRQAPSEPASEPAKQASTPPPADDAMTSPRDAARLAPPAEQASPVARAAIAETPAATHLLGAASQHAHLGAPVVVIRAAHHGAEGALPQERIALAIVRQVQEGVSRFEIRLDPPELGRIEVKLSLRADGHVSAQLAADRPDTLELLQRDARVLQRALTDAGLHMDSGSLSFGLRERGNRQAFDQDEASPSQAVLDADEDEVSALPYGTALTASLEPGRVDLRI